MIYCRDEVISSLGGETPPLRLNRIILLEVPYE